MSNQLTVNQKARISMDGLLKDDAYWAKQIKLKLKENSSAFITSLTELYSEDSQLAQCNATDVIKQAMIAASVGLPINKSIGHCYMTVFKNKGVATPTLMISARGFVQLAQRTGMYKVINANILYEGQIVEEDYLSGTLKIQKERTSDKVVGFFAYFETKFGYSQTLYMTVEEICHHAKTYSNAIKFNKSVTEQTLADLIQKEAKEGPVAGVAGWLGSPIAMAKKTVLKSLLYKYGPLSVETAKVMAEEDMPLGEIREATEPTETIDITESAEEVDPETGEVKTESTEEELELQCPV